MEKTPNLVGQDQVYTKYLTPGLQQVFKINPWTIWMLNLTIQVFSRLQLASNYCAKKALNYFFNCKFHILSNCLHSTSLPAS